MSNRVVRRGISENREKHARIDGPMQYNGVVATLSINTDVRAWGMDTERSLNRGIYDSMITTFKHTLGLQDLWQNTT